MNAPRWTARVGPPEGTGAGTAGSGGPAPADTAAQEAQARDLVLRQLAIMARSRDQLRRKLLDRGVTADVATTVLDRFEAVGLVDDAGYAEMFVRTRREQRGLSRRALAREMRTRGVDPETAATALEGVTREDEESTALALARKKAAATRDLDRSVRERRIAAMLGRKGYPAEVVLKVTRRALTDEE